MTARLRRDCFRPASPRRFVAAVTLIALSLPSLATEEAQGAERTPPTNSLRAAAPTASDESHSKLASPAAQKAAATNAAAEALEPPALRPVRQVAHLQPVAEPATRTAASPEMPSLVAPEQVYPAPFVNGPFEPEMGYLDAPGGIPCDSGGTCDGFGCQGGCEPACGIEPWGDPWCRPLIQINWSRFDLFAGVHGFTGPTNFAGTDGTARSREGTASFGFHEGFNWGSSFPNLFCGLLSSQFGVRTTQSNFSGAEFTEESRQQVFLTGGFFRRVDWGMQGGMVVDYLHDDWYFQSDLVQLRGELSWMGRACHEAGFRFTTSTQQSRSSTLTDIGAGPVAGTVTWEATNQNLFFYRHHLREAATAELAAGFTDTGDGLVRAMLDLPLADSVGLQTGFTYLAPEEGSAASGHQEESWNVGVTLVWRPCRTGTRRNDYHRPLFDVADNGSFLVDRVR